jgi:hypothetical protein
MKITYLLAISIFVFTLTNTQSTFAKGVAGEIICNPAVDVDQSLVKKLPSSNPGLNELTIRMWIQVAVDSLNSHAGEFAPEVKEMIKQVKVIYVTDDVSHSAVHVEEGFFELTIDQVKAGALWIASAIAHEGCHTWLYQKGVQAGGPTLGYKLAIGDEAEKKCMTVQYRVGEIIGLQAAHLKRLQELFHSNFDYHHRPFVILGQPPPKGGTPPTATPGTSLQFEVSDQAFTGLELFPGDVVSITATGTVGLGFFAGEGGPEGIVGYRQYNLWPNVPHGCLVALLRMAGPNSPVYKIGRSATFKVEKRSILEVWVNDNDADNNTGGFQVEVKVKRQNKTAAPRRK